MAKNKKLSNKAIKKNLSQETTETTETTSAGQSSATVDTTETTSNVDYTETDVTTSEDAAGADPAESASISAIVSSLKSSLSAIIPSLKLHLINCNFKAADADQLLNFIADMQSIWKEEAQIRQSYTLNAGLKSLSSIILQLYSVCILACRSRKDSEHMAIAQYYVYRYQKAAEKLGKDEAITESDYQLAEQEFGDISDSFENNFKNSEIFDLDRSDNVLRQEYDYAKRRKMSSKSALDECPKSVANLKFESFNECQTEVKGFLTSAKRLQRQGKESEIIVSMLTKWDQRCTEIWSNAISLQEFISEYAEAYAQFLRDHYLSLFYETVLKFRHVSTVTTIEELKNVQNKYKEALNDEATLSALPELIQTSIDNADNKIKEFDICLAQIDQKDTRYAAFVEAKENCEKYIDSQKQTLAELEQKKADVDIQLADWKIAFEGALCFKRVLLQNDGTLNGKTLYRAIGFEGPMIISKIREKVAEEKDSYAEVVKVQPSDHLSEIFNFIATLISALFGKSAEERTKTFENTPLDALKKYYPTVEKIQKAVPAEMNLSEQEAAVAQLNEKYYNALLRTEVLEALLKVLSEPEEKVAAIAGSIMVGVSLLPIKGISHQMCRNLSCLGIRDVSGLLASCRSHSERVALATKLSLYDSGVSVEDITSWVSQADLWRITNMTPDFAYLMVQAGIRCVNDLSLVYAESVYKAVTALAYSQPDFDAPALDQIRNLIDNAGMKVRAGNEYQLEFEDGSELPVHLMASTTNDIEGHKTDSEILLEGLSFLDDIDITLPLPSYVMGYVKMIKTGSTEMSVMSDTLVSLEGIASSANASTTDDKKIETYTDSNGRFILTLPDNYCMSEGLTIKFSRGSDYQEFSLTANEIKEKVFVNAANAQDGERIYAKELVNTLTRANTINKEILQAQNELESLSLIDGQIEALILQLASNTDAAQRHQLALQLAELQATQASALETDRQSSLQAIVSSKTAELQQLLAVIVAADNTTNDFATTLNNLLYGEPLKAELDDFVIDEDVFKGYEDVPDRALPKVKLMDKADKAIYLPTDTAPTQVYSYSILHRLVEPELRKAKNDSVRDEVVTRVKVPDAIDVDAFKEDLSANPYQVPVMSSLGMGYTLSMHQAWVPDGYALGDLLYSLILAPGEEQRLIVRENSEEYEVTDDADAEDVVTELYDDEQVEDTQSAFDDAIEQMMSGSSSMSSNSQGWSVGGSASVSSNGFAGAISGGYSSSSSSGSFSASQRNSHNEVSSAAQQFQHAIKTSSEKISQARRVSMRIASSSDSHSVATKVIANHNHMHAMTVQYWEVMRRYRLETCIDGVNLLLFVPLEPVRFLPSGVEKADTTAQTPEKLKARYAVVNKYYEQIYHALPRKYRYGFSLIQKYCTLPTWEMQYEVKEQSVQPILELTIEGNFAFYDDINVVVKLKNNKGRVAGQLSLNAEQMSAFKNWQKIYDEKDEEKKERAKKLRTRNEVITQIKEERRTAGNNKLSFKFTLPMGATDQDLDQILVTRQCNDYEFTFPAEYDSEEKKSDYKDWEYKAIKNYLNKLDNLYQDDDDSSSDIRKINHYLEGVPYSYTHRTILIPGGEVRRLSAVRLCQNLSVKLDGKTIENAVWCSGQELASGTGYIKVGKSTPVLTHVEFQKMETVFTHILDQTMRYSQVIWSAMTADERAMMLEQYSIDMDFSKVSGNASDVNLGSIPLLNCVNVKNLVGFYGNCMLLPFTYPQRLADHLGKSAADIQNELYRYHTDNFRVPITTISLPTSGMIGEAVLGETNVAEEIDLTRFWNWKDAPIDNLDIDESYLDNTDSLAEATTSDISALNLSSAQTPDQQSAVDLLSSLMKKSVAFDNLTNLANASTLLKNNEDATKTSLETAVDNSSKLLEAAWKNYQSRQQRENDEKVKEAKLKKDDETSETDGSLADQKTLAATAAEKKSADEKLSAVKAEKENAEKAVTDAESELKVIGDKITELKAKQEDSACTDEEKTSVESQLKAYQQQEDTVKQKLQTVKNELSEKQDQLNANIAEAESNLRQAERDNEVAKQKVATQIADYVCENYPDTEISQEEIETLVKLAEEAVASSEESSLSKPFQKIADEMLQSLRAMDTELPDSLSLDGESSQVSESEEDYWGKSLGIHKLTEEEEKISPKLFENEVFKNWFKNNWVYKPDYYKVISIKTTKCLQRESPFTKEEFEIIRKQFKRWARGLSSEFDKPTLKVYLVPIFQWIATTTKERRFQIAQYFVPNLTREEAKMDEDDSEYSED